MRGHHRAWQVLYLGAASGTTVSHVSDMVGPTGMVYAVEFSHRSGRDLTTMAKTRQPGGHNTEPLGCVASVYPGVMWKCTDSARNA